MDILFQRNAAQRPALGNSPAGSIAALVQRWARLRAGPVHRTTEDWPDTIAAVWSDEAGGRGTVQQPIHAGSPRR
jgi:hypothetical protein